jgi:plastocyanin
MPLYRAEPSIKNLELDQRTIFFATGATITWHNNDDMFHSVTSDEGWFDADVQPGEAFSWQPTEPGIYPYHTIADSTKT